MFSHRWPGKPSNLLELSHFFEYCKTWENNQAALRHWQYNEGELMPVKDLPDKPVEVEDNFNYAFKPQHNEIVPRLGEAAGGGWLAGTVLPKLANAAKGVGSALSFGWRLNN